MNKSELSQMFFSVFVGIIDFLVAQMVKNSPAIWETWV